MWPDCLIGLIGVFVNLDIHSSFISNLLMARHQGKGGGGEYRRPNSRKKEFPLKYDISNEYTYMHRYTYLSFA